MPDRLIVNLGRISSNPFDRSSMALARLLDIDPMGASRAILSPETLSPAERETLADRWGVGKGTWYETIIRTVTNPIVLIGLILATRFPIPTARNLFKFAPALEGLARDPGLVRRFVGGIDTTFHGLKAGKSTLPEVYKTLLRDVEGFRELHLKRLANAITTFEKSTGRQFDRRAQILLAAKLDRLDAPNGILHAIREGPEFDTLAKEARTVLDDIWDRVFGAIDKRALSYALEKSGLSASEYSGLVEQRRLARKVGRKVGSEISSQLKSVSAFRRAAKSEIMEQLRNAGIEAGTVGEARRRAGYFPHMVSRSMRDFGVMVERLIGTTPSELEYGEAMLGGAGRTVHGIERRGLMLIDPSDLKEIRGYLKNDGLIAQIEQRLAGPKAPMAYSLHFNRSMAAYVQSTARAWGWTIRGHGSAIRSSLAALERSGLPHNKIRAQMLKSHYIPVALGRMTHKQLMAANQWDAMKLNLVNNLVSGGLSKVLPKDINEFFLQNLTSDTGLLTLRTVQGRLASHIYLGALAMNPVSSAWNLMQTLLTTIPLIGPKATYRGLERVFKQLPRYFELRKSGMAHEVALGKAFKHFGEAGLTGAPITDEVLHALDRAWDMSIHLPPAAGGKVDLVKRAMMSFFTASENLVRLTAFEGSMSKALSEGVEHGAAVGIARRVTEASQFLTGPANIPYMFLNSGPLVRQFGTFIFRYLDFLMNTATEVGSGAQSGGMFGLFPNRNLGTLGRAMLTSGVAYEAAKGLFGQDISQGLMFGALPSRPEGSLLYPLPYLPPAFSIGAGAVKAAFTGETEELVRQLPILVPGGVQLARMSTSMAPSLARLLGRNYADYEGKLPDGRIPVYTASGRLRAYLSPLQLHMHALGVPPGGSGRLQDERELERFLTGNRDRIRMMRAEFVDALEDNDIRKATEINRQYEEAYPGFGRLQIRPQDLRAVHLRKMVPRLERVLESLPADMRPEFAQLIRMTLLEQGESLLGVDPMLLQGVRTTRQRDFYRKPRAGGVVEAMYQRQIDRHKIQAPGLRRSRTGAFGQRPSGQPAPALEQAGFLGG